MDSYNFSIYQGIDFNVGVTVKDDLGEPINLSGYSIVGGVKFAYSQSGYSQPFSGLIMSQESGLINLMMDGSLTSQLHATQYVYGVHAVSDQDVIKILEGYISVYPDIGA